MFLKDGARATVCTFAQIANEWAKGISYDIIIVDEASKLAEGQLAQI